MARKIIEGCEEQRVNRSEGHSAEAHVNTSGMSDVKTRRHRLSRYLWGLVILVVFSIAAGSRTASIQPSGKDSGLVQFDVVSKYRLKASDGASRVVFSRCWVSKTYYAAAFSWAEPFGFGQLVKGQVFFSDEDNFRIDDFFAPDLARMNRTCPKPVGDRPPLYCDHGFYKGRSDLCFAEAQTLARRVYVSDFDSAKGKDGMVDMDVSSRGNGVARDLAHIKAQIQDDRIGAMELSDKDGELLAAIRYEYDRRGGSAGLATLVAELPVRPQKLDIGTDAQVLPDGELDAKEGVELNYVDRKGGRRCTIRYQDVALGAKCVRLPVEIQVHRIDTDELLHCAKLTNFKQVDLDKAGVRRAAETFAGPDAAHPRVLGFIKKFFDHHAKLGPPSIDPNDLTAVWRFLSKYPVFERPPGPDLTKVKRARLKDHVPSSEDESEHPLKEWRQQVRKEMAEREALSEEWKKRVAAMPRPPRQHVGEEDTRLIRQLRSHYWRVLKSQPTEAQKETIDKLVAQGESVHWGHSPPRDITDVYHKLKEILRYHQFDPLPEDRAPEPNEADIGVIRELIEHYERLSRQDDRGLGGQFRAIFAMTQLDRMIRDWDAFDGHVRHYLQMMADAEFDEMYLRGGIVQLNLFIGAGRYERLDRQLRTWVDRAATVNSPESVFRWCGAFGGGQRAPLISVKVLDRLLKRSDLSTMERYEALALRAIFWDRIDTLLRDSKASGGGASAAQKAWFLRHGTQEQITDRTLHAVVEAAQAWRALGPARYAEARPYSTESAAATAMKLTEAVEATRLQETSAKLDAIVQRRTVPKRPPPRLDDAGWRQPRRKGRRRR